MSGARAGQTKFSLPFSRARAMPPSPMKKGWRSNRRVRSTVRFWVVSERPGASRVETMNGAKIQAITVEMVRTRKPARVEMVLIVIVAVAAARKKP